MSHQTTIVRLNGSFQIKPTEEGKSEGVMRVSDPCYSRTPAGAGTFKCLSGEWYSTIEMFDEGNWGKRVGTLTIYHASMPIDSVAPLDKSTSIVDVDSGQAGFYDESRYEEIYNARYEEMCNITLAHAQAGVFDCGVVSSSGFGDGSYGLYLQLNEEGLAVAAKIVFIGDSDEDEEDIDYEDEDEFNEEEDDS